MFIYVFTEQDREKMKEAGFAFVAKDEAAHAWVFDETGGNHAVLNELEAVRSNRLNF